MPYDDAPEKTTDLTVVGQLRRAMAPYVEEVAKVAPTVADKLDSVMKTIEDNRPADPVPTDLSGVESLLTDLHEATKAARDSGDAKAERIYDAMIALAKGFESTQASDVAYKSAVNGMLGELGDLIKAANDRGDSRLDDLLTGLQSHMLRVEKASGRTTDPNNPRDYVNVRLTDGEDFYTALKRMASAVAGGSTVSFQDATGKPVRATLNSDGSIATSAPKFALKLQTSGTDTFLGEALPGSAQSAAVWRCQKVDASGNITWADGNSNFDNIATDLTALTYS